jgi:iron complex outermembrane receptor protein
MIQHDILKSRAKWLGSAAMIVCMGMQSHAVAAAAEAAGLEEIVVTAQKRTENVQSVPISITAFSAATLSAKGIGNVTQLASLTPNVTLDAGSPFSGSSNVLTAYIRGIGQDDFAFNLEPGVGVYVDGVYLARTVGANVNLLDVERVEILKGPQGDLFGRNTIGGAISIVTRRPSEEFHFRGEVTTGRYNRLDVKGMVDLPLAPTLLSTLTFSSNKREGYQKRIPYPGGGAYVYDNGFHSSGTGVSGADGGQGDWTLRGKLLWKASDKLEVTLTGDYSKTDESGMASSLLQTHATQQDGLLGTLYNTCINLPSGLLDIIGLGGICNRPRGVVGTAIGGVNADANPNNNRLSLGDWFIAPSKDTSYATGNSFSRIKNYGGTLILDWSLTDDLKLKSTTAYRKLDWASAMDGDSSPIAIIETSFQMKEKQFSQELQLTGQAMDNRLQYILGAYYFDESGNLHDFVTFDGGLLQIDGQNLLSTKSYAGYAHINYKVTDQLSFTLGGRYTREEKKFEGFQSDLNGLFYGLANMPINATSAAILGFPDPTNPLRMYPVGQNSLNFNNFSPKAGIEFHATQDVMLYASMSKGFKSGGWTTRLTYPLPPISPTVPAKAPSFRPEKATTYEVGLKSEFLDHRAQLNLAGFYSKYKDMQLNYQVSTSPVLGNVGNAEIYGFEAEFKARVTSAFTLAANVGYTHDKYTWLDQAVLSQGITLANKLPKTPEWKFSLSPQYRIDLSNGGNVLLSADYTRTSSLFNNTENTPVMQRTPNSMLNASMTYAEPNDRWEIVVGGTNLTNDRFLTTGQNQWAGGVTYGTYNRPTEWYATFKVKI